MHTHAHSRKANRESGESGRGEATLAKREREVGKRPISYIRSTLASGSPARKVGRKSSIARGTPFGRISSRSLSHPNRLPVVQPRDTRGPFLKFPSRCWTHRGKFWHRVSCALLRVVFKSTFLISARIGRKFGTARLLLHTRRARSSGETVSLLLYRYISNERVWSGFSIITRQSKKNL